ncbi:MAG: type II toxin-antitoxin system RelE/ParE family toxin [Thermoplasmatota archaeon]
MPVRFHPHALEELSKEGISEARVASVLDGEHDFDDGSLARKRSGGKTLIIYYRQRESYIYVHGFSATTRKLD